MWIFERTDSKALFVYLAVNPRKLLYSSKGFSFWNRASSLTMASIKCSHTLREFPIHLPQRLLQLKSPMCSSSPSTVFYLYRERFRCNPQLPFTRNDQSVLENGWHRSNPHASRPFSIESKIEAIGSPFLRWKWWKMESTNRSDFKINSDLSLATPLLLSIWSEFTERSLWSGCYITAGEWLWSV